MSGKVFTADFETTTDPEDVRVWAWAICNEKEKVTINNSIESFIEEINRSKYNNKKMYFHNLAFDGVFIIDHLLKNGWEFSYETRKMRPYEFNCLVGGMGEFYSLILQFPKYKIKIYDSLKVLPMTVESMPKTFGFDDLVLKGDIDYHAYRPVGHEITDEERKYIENDVIIVMKAIKFLHEIGDTKLTTSSNAMADFKGRVGDNMFSYLFPKLSVGVDDFIRASYKGGFTYLNPKYRGRVIEGGIVLDVNSLYPAMMRNNYLPVGTPQYFEGKYVKDDLMPLYVQRIYCSFELKKGYIPTIQIKNNYYFKSNEYLESSEGERVLLTLTNIDLKLFLEHYDVIVYSWVDGFKFMQRNDVFIGYIDYWTKVKIESKENGNKGMYALSKLKLNSLYGKFGTNPNSPTKIPYLDDEGVVRWETIQGERDPVYIPMASFITAYAREKTIRDSQKHYDRYIYSDTDSIHLEGHDDPHDLEVHPTKLGAWDLEYKFKRGKYLKQKTYIDELFDGTFKTGVAGMTKSLQKKLTFDNFKFGVEFDGVLKKKTVKGGVVLIDSTFKLKE